MNEIQKKIKTTTKKEKKEKKEIYERLKLLCTCKLSINLCTFAGWILQLLVCIRVISLTTSNIVLDLVRITAYP